VARGNLSYCMMMLLAECCRNPPPPPPPPPPPGAGGSQPGVPSNGTCLPFSKACLVLGSPPLKVARTSQVGNYPVPRRGAAWHALS